MDTIVIDTAARLKTGSQRAFVFLHQSALRGRPAIVQQLGVDVGAVADLVVVDSDVRICVGYPAHTPQRVAGHLVVLVGRTALLGGLADVAARQVDLY